MEPFRLIIVIIFIFFNLSKIVLSQEKKSVIYGNSSIATVKKSGHLESQGIRFLAIQDVLSKCDDKNDICFYGHTFFYEKDKPNIQEHYKYITSVQALFNILPREMLDYPGFNIQEGFSLSYFEQDPSLLEIEGLKMDAVDNALFWCKRDFDICEINLSSLKIINKKTYDQSHKKYFFMTEARALVTAYRLKNEMKINK